MQEENTEASQQNISTVSPQTNQVKDSSDNRGSYNKKILLLGVLVILIVLSFTLIAHILEFGYTIKNETVPEIAFSALVSKNNPQVSVKTTTYENKFITPRKVTIPRVNFCFTDKASKKEKIGLSTIYNVEIKSRFYTNKPSRNNSGDEVWIYPFSTVKVTYLAQGNWYDYAFQYMDYNELDLITSKTLQPVDCEGITSTNEVEKVSITNTCIGCVNKSDKGPNGPDVAVVDFIANDDKIWHGGHINFVPIIKNVGTELTGRIKVTYYLNGKFSSSFDLQNLDSGEVVNNFIAGSGFQGNFSADSPDMELKVEVKTLDVVDVNPANNEYKWKFTYSNSPLPKHTCSYTNNNQGPRDFYTATSIDYSGKKYKDLCIDSENLLEYMCDNHPIYKGDANIAVFLYKCPEGCNEGACIGEYHEASVSAALQ